MEIKTTNDYSKFKYIIGNRSINEHNKNRIKISINKIGQQMPMLVAEKDLTDNKYPVIDGQHRLEAIKTLNLPVDFIVSNKTNANNIDEIQVSKQWTTLDFCKRNAALGSRICKKALRIAYEWNIETKNKFASINVLDLLDKNQGTTKKSLKNNTYQINLDRAIRVYEVCNILKNYPNQFRNVYANRIVDSLKKLDKTLNGINIKVIEKVAKKNYLYYYQSKKDQYQYILNLYKKYNK